MDVRQAVQVAKKYIEDLYADEHVTYVGLEEVQYLDEPKLWSVTIGFFRPWQNADEEGLAVDPKSDPFAAANFGLGRERYLKRSFKVIEISDESGAVVALKNHELAV